MATPVAPAAAIMLVASIFLVNNMVLPIRLTERLRPKVPSYWCYSSDAWGGYSTVTETKVFGDRR
jgi:hypothetical protein